MDLQLKGTVALVAGALRPLSETLSVALALGFCAWAWGRPNTRRIGAVLAQELRECRHTFARAAQRVDVDLECEIQSGE